MGNLLTAQEQLQLLHARLKEVDVLLTAIISLIDKKKKKKVECIYLKIRRKLSPKLTSSEQVLKPIRLLKLILRETFNNQHCCFAYVSSYISEWHASSFKHNEYDDFFYLLSSIVL